MLQIDPARPSKWTGADRQWAAHRDFPIDTLEEVPDRVLVPAEDFAVDILPK